jgi:hypothetical protein
MCIHTTPTKLRPIQTDRDRALCEIAEKEGRRLAAGAELTERESAEQQAILDNLGMTLAEAVAEGNRLWTQGGDPTG